MRESKSRDIDGYVLRAPRVVLQDHVVWDLNMEGVSLSHFIARARRSKGTVRERLGKDGRKEIKVGWRKG